MPTWLGRPLAIGSLSKATATGKRQFHYWTKQDNRTARVAHILQSKLNLKQKKMSFRRQRVLDAQDNPEGIITMRV